MHKSNKGLAMKPWGPCARRLARANLRFGLRPSAFGLRPSAREAKNMEIIPKQLEMEETSSGMAMAAAGCHRKTVKNSILGRLIITNRVTTITTTKL